MAPAAARFLHFADLPTGLGSLFMTGDEVMVVPGETNVAVVSSTPKTPASEPITFLYPTSMCANSPPSPSLLCLGVCGTE
jgi:hypothetical protein